jgi:hypothetical protein
MRRRVQAVLGKANLAASTKPPFLIRRYPYKGQQEMHAALGDLAAPTRWEAVDTPPTGQLADIFTHTPGAHKWTHYLPYMNQSSTVIGLSECWRSGCSTAGRCGCGGSTCTPTR